LFYNKKKATINVKTKRLVLHAQTHVQAHAHTHIYTYIDIHIHLSVMAKVWHI
jgi:hypothetical protein